MVSGLLYHYSVQQQSNKIEAYGPMYFKNDEQNLVSEKVQLFNRDVSLGQICYPTGSQPYDAGEMGKGLTTNVNYIRTIRRKDQDISL